MVPGIGSLTGSLTNSGSMDLSAGPSQSGDAQSSAGFDFGGINNSTNGVSPLVLLAVAGIFALVLLKK